MCSGVSHVYDMGSLRTCRQSLTHKKKEVPSPNHHVAKWFKKNEVTGQNKVTRAKWGEHSSFGVTFASFLLKFGLYGEVLELPGAFFDATSQYSQKSIKENVKIETLGRLWTCLGKLLASLCMPSCRLAVFVQAFCRHSGYFMQKSWILRYRCPSQAESLFVQVRASKSEPLGPKVRSGRPKVASKGQVGVKFGRSVRGALSKLWKRLANRRAAAQT